MCILCVIQKWSRKAATMLPWLVIPLIALWLLSQFLPPAFRFEITSPRLACVLVLLLTLFWYEVMMPLLSSWQVRRNARLKERKRLEAIELQKLRKTATRRCRNCFTPYRDQNPSGGRFTCSYCGRISKKPVLELSMPPGLDQLSSSKSLKDLIKKNGKVWSDNNWIYGQDWPENGGNWVNGSLFGNSKKNRGSFSNGSNDHFSSGKSNSFFLVFIHKTLATIFLGILWLWRKLFRVSSGKGDTSSDVDTMGLTKKGENFNESRIEKARRKAEEKRQARLEREQLEEEERKQREEVARLVEERRKLRDVKTETVKDQHKASHRGNGLRRETERKRQERKKEKDLRSSKSSSDVDELEKRAGKEKNRKDEPDHHEHQRSKTGSSKFITTNNHNKGSDGSRYLDRMKGRFFPSSRTLSGGGFFGKKTNSNVQITVTKRDFVPPERAHRKSSANGDDQKHNRPVVFESEPNPAPKRSWRQLFSRPSSTPSSTTTNFISGPFGNPQTEISSGFPVTEGFDNPIPSGMSHPLPGFPFENSINMEGSRLSSNSVIEELDQFETPCYEPDPTSLIGPVSESLDDFQLDLGPVGFEENIPLPFESQLQVSSEMSADSFFFPRTQGSYDKLNLPKEDHSTENEKGWQMWNSSPFEDTLGSVGGLPKWYFPEQKAAAETYNGFAHTIGDDPWKLRSSYGSMSSNTNQISIEGTAQNELVYGGGWAKNEDAARVSDETPTMIPPVGELNSTPDVQSFWSYK